ncbi:MAG: hypothetical protein IPK04_17460 [Bdellovibrionales bacterium]|jgi:hypothetical protein|nr:hypothetical protein [Bdellovibrionales bacterium]
MGPLAKKYKKKYAYELARIAQGDLDSAKALCAAKIGRPENVSQPDAFLLGSLSQYATIRKYEEGSEELSHDDFQNCIQLAGKILSWAHQILGPEKSTP